MHAKKNTASKWTQTQANRKAIQPPTTDLAIYKSQASQT
jgi:hypothetical protein